MATYIWPGIPEQAGESVLIRFPDWGTLHAAAPDFKAALEQAKEQLRLAVIDRIDNKLNLPAPSDLRPEQIGIPLDDVTGARLTAHIENLKLERFRQEAELEAIRNQKMDAYLTDYRESLDLPNRNIDTADQAAIDFSLTAVKSAYVLNGGALVAIPAILQIPAKIDIAFGWLFASVTVFVVGMCFACGTNLLAYLSMRRASVSWDAERAARAREAVDRHYPQSDDTTREESQAFIVEQRTLAADQLQTANLYSNLGVLTWSASILAFLGGLMAAIYSAT